MNAIISGCVGLAVVTEGTSTRTLRIDEAGEISEQYVLSPGCLLRDVRDLEVLSDVTMDQACALLARARRREDALQMTLILLNNRSAEDIRAQASIVLDGILSDDPTIREAVERTLFAVPLPPGANVDAAVTACHQTGSGRASAMVCDLDARQPHIAAARRAWDPLENLFTSRDAFLRFQAVLIWEGFFRGLVECLASGVGLASFVASVWSNQRVTRLENHGDVLRRWLAEWHGGRHAGSGASMSERRYAWEYIFIETKVFGEHHGTLSKSERERLDFDIAQGNGQDIPDTGGLKRIRCGPAGWRSKSDEGWEAVFAEYVYPDIRRRFFVLLDKIPLAVDRTLSQEEKQQVRQLKEKVDDLIGHWYGEIQAEDEEELDG